eukprot:scaffold117586_cov33-Tisochrysis_lutea.AAC.6
MERPRLETTDAETVAIRKKVVLTKLHLTPKMSYEAPPKINRGALSRTDIVVVDVRMRHTHPHTITYALALGRPSSHERSRRHLACNSRNWHHRLAQ